MTNMVAETTGTSILTAATRSLKLVNEDHCIVSKGDLNVIAVADGIGSSANAQLGAEQVVRRADEVLRSSNEDELDLGKLFIQIQKDLDAWITEIQPDALEGSFGTTLIIAIETPSRVIFGYIGNGAIFHIRGNITNFKSDVYYLPWICVNYLNPHSIPVGGKPALTRHFGKKMVEEKVTPTIFTIEKDTSESGDIFVLCTDGIYSTDHAAVARDKEEDIWVEGSRSVELLLKKIRSFLKGEEHHDEELDLNLTNYLNELQTTPGLMNDDCTIGVIVTQRAIEYQKNNANDTTKNQ